MYCYGWEKTDAGHSWNSLKGLKLELQDYIMERLFVILTFECVMCFHSNTGDRCCVTRSFSGEICMGLKIYVRCCVATVSSKIIKVARGGTPLQEANRDVPLDGVALSRLE